MISELVIGMAGSGGDGIVSAGDALIGAAARGGYYGLMTKSFGPQIRGGESSCRVRIATGPVHSPGGALDLAIALNWEDFLRFGAELTVASSTVVVWDSATGVTRENLPLSGVVPAQALSVPFGELARTAAGTDKAKNSVILGLIAGWLGLDPSFVLDGLRARFLRKSEALFLANERAFQVGIAHAQINALAVDRTLSAPIRPQGNRAPKLLTDGNDMTAAAAIFAGCEFFSGYPITPSTEIMQLLTRELWKYGGSVLQAEDEIAGLGAAVGASFAGKKAMSATSGPGMDLKTEVLGLATIAEIPLVLINVQRGGPSTGLPTKAEQGDLFQACFSGHGDVLRPVLAPTCVADTFEVTVSAFNIAETYQTPVLVLSDQEIAQRKETVDPIDTSRYTIATRKTPSAEQLQDYKRFLDTPSGVSPMSAPGMAGGAYLASGIEHNEVGDPAANGAMHAKMNDKRFRKLAPLKRQDDLLLCTGDARAELALIGWGSCAGVCREALELAQAAGLRVKLLVPLLLYPIAEERYAQFFEGVKGGLVVEQSHQGQLYRILRMYVDVPRGMRALCRGGAQPFQPAEVLEALQSLSPKAS